MADVKDIEFVFNKLSEVQQTELSMRLNDTHAGIGAVLKILDESGGAVTCGDIAKKMNVSTARVAVLIKKMVAKNLVTRAYAQDDARIIYILLTQEGKNIIKELRSLISEHLSRLIDTLGMKKIIDFIHLSEEIRRVAEEVRPNPPDFIKNKK